MHALNRLSGALTPLVSEAEKPANSGKGSKPFPYKGNSGFTLLELIIAIALTSVIAVIISQALSLAIRAREAGERRTRADQRARIILNKLSGEITSVYFYKYKKKPASQNSAPSSNSPIGELLAFKGDHKTLSFISSGKLSGENGAEGGLKEVYVYTEEPDSGRNGKLYIVERTLSSSAPLDMPRKSGAEFVYSDSVAGLLFRYLLVDKKKSPVGNTVFSPEYWIESYNLNPKASKTSEPVLIGVEVSLTILEENADEKGESEHVVDYPPLFIRVHANQEIMVDEKGV